MFDVIVVGGGPSGSSAARRCSQLGLKTLLIDKAVFARDKLCGGAVSEYALSNLDFDLPDHLVEREIYSIRIHHGDRAVEAKTTRPLAVLVKRADFDHYLLQKAEEAGTKVIQGRAVHAVCQEKDYIEIKAGRDVYRSRLVIGCDGFHGIVARQIRSKARKDEYGICMEAFIPATEEEIRGRGEQVLEIHVGIVKCGYGWIFPHRGYLSVGLGGEAASLTNLKEVMERFLATTGFLTGSKARGAPIPAGGIYKSVIADRILLAGDAAGFVDTFSGEGIGFAIRSGQLAGETAFSAVQRGQYSKKYLQVYESRCTREFRSDFKYSLYFTRLFHRFPHYCFRIMTAEPEILRKYIEIPRRRLSYRGFILWLFWRMPLLWWKARRMH